MGELLKAIDLNSEALEDITENEWDKIKKDKENIYIKFLSLKNRSLNLNIKN